MPLIMAGLDYRTTPIALRERFSFSEKNAKAFMTRVQEMDGVQGCVLMATCNRTELYLSIEPDCTVCPEQLLLDAAGVDKTEMRERFFRKRESEAVLYLMEVACGLHSQILHEEQIVTQVGQAIALARNCHAADAALDTLFRTAVSAGKYAQTNVSITAVPLSISYSAVQMLEQNCGDLTGKVCVVVGNGKMGRLAAELLVERGCQVYVTLRTYHHGESIVPFGTTPIPYEERFSKIDGADIVLSATRSPHYTVTAEQLEALEKKPAWIMDLALPRDVEESCRQVPGVECRNLDDFENGTEPDRASMEALHQTAMRYAEEFRMWRNYRDSVPYIRQLKTLSADRLMHSTALDAYRENAELEEIVRLVTEKTIDMILGGIKPEVTPDLMRNCCEKVHDRARSLKR
ncbi:glutamyl-tRNA reductase [uncultured Ruminococcus sp.]|uniref:glutamyl-tRNA reductase n=1 Tax=uncultured Ruminococcus sp. TaxID=165186 RepID=UPI0026173103|nr:glutamyl-tRNA reductase [uncultured Ruminococcus sp.]